MNKFWIFEYLFVVGKLKRVIFKFLKDLSKEEINKELWIMFFKNVFGKCVCKEIELIFFKCY